MMNKKFYFCLCMMLMMLVTTGCKEDFDNPPMIVPKATHTPNTTIAELKAKYWKDGRNFCDTIKEEIVIHGWVSGNDVSGNLYKVLYIQDETGGIGISLDASSLATDYRLGQEIVLNLKDRWIGKYNGQYLLGYPEWYAAQSTWEAGRMQLEIFKQFCEINGLPDMDKVAPVVTKITDFQGKSDMQTQLTYSGQLVKIYGLKWEGADGKLKFSEDDATTNRIVTDENGNQLIVRNSNYADFHSEVLPISEGDLTGILVMTGSDTWQLFLREFNDVEFDMDTKGTQAEPYTVAEFIENQGNGRNRWMTGYVVGAVAPEVTTVSGNGDIEWKAPTTLATTLVIADNADVKDIAKCVIVPLPQGSRFREQANLANNPEVYQTQIWVKGVSEKYMGANGVTGNSGSTSEYRLSVATGGITQLNEGFEGGLPNEWLNVQVSGDKKWYTTSFDNNTYAAMTGYKGNPPFDSWLITPALAIGKAEHKNLKFRTQVNGYGSKTTTFEVYVMSSADPATATMVKLNPTIATAPASGYSSWAQSGDLDLSQFAGTYYIGFRYAATTDANYATWCVDDVKFNYTAGDNPPPTPTPAGTRADFETMNGGSPKSSYGTLESSAGWKAVNCNLLSGGTTDSNPTFQFIGFMDGSTTQYAFAPCLNGKTSAVGTLTSPVLKGGVKKVKFNYAMPYGDTTIKFRLDIVQAAGGVKKSWDIELTAPVKYQVYTFEETCDVDGEFQLLFYNLSPTQQDANKDRVCIWNVNWENKSARVNRH